MNRALSITITGQEGRVNFITTEARLGPCSDAIGDDRWHAVAGTSSKTHETRLFQVPPGASAALDSGITLASGLKARIVDHDGPGLTFVGPGAAAMRNMGTVYGMKRSPLPELPEAWVSALASGDLMTPARAVHIAGLRGPLALTEPPKPAAVAVAAVSQSPTFPNYKAATPGVEAAPIAVTKPTGAAPGVVVVATEPASFRSLQEAMRALLEGRITTGAFRSQVINAISTPGGL